MEDPHPIQFLIQIAGAAALLIWAVRLVRTGVERGFAAPLRFWLRHSAKNRLLAAVTGMGAAVFLQSSTAVAVLVSNFVAKGGVATAVGLTILLGADVGCYAASDGAPADPDTDIVVAGRRGFSTCKRQQPPSWSNSDWACFGFCVVRYDPCRDRTIDGQSRNADCHGLPWE